MTWLKSFIAFLVSEKVWVWSLVAAVTTVNLICALAIQFTTVNYVFNLHLYYFLLAGAVFIFGFRSGSMLYLVLGSFLFARFTVENYQYDWSPILTLFWAHLLLGLVIYYTVLGAKQRILLYFPLLIFCQAALDMLYYHTNFTYYVYLHNLLALMQMSAFLVLAWQRQRIIEPEIDPIVNLMSRLQRDWLLLRQSAVKIFPSG